MLDAEHRFSGSADSLLGDDWRGPGSIGAKIRGSSPRAPVPGLGPAGLHIGARRANAVQERHRARQVVEAAKAEVSATFENARFGRAIKPEALLPLVIGINASIERHATAILGVTRIKERHEYTYLHSIAVCGLMIGLARRMKIDPTLHHDIGLAGLLHDIGKARVPTALLDKPGELTAEEMSVIRNHSLWGYEMLLGGGRMPDLVLDVCLHHHERIDGAGYPDGKAGSGVSQFARMATICDVYDAVTSLRPYKRVWSPAEAIEWMASDPGQFDPEILSHFSALIGIFPPGSLVRLQSDRLAVVLDDPEADPMVPPVSPFFCIRTKCPLSPRWASSKIDPIVGIEMPARWKINNWQDVRNSLLATFAHGKPEDME